MNLFFLRPCGIALAAITLLSAATARAELVTNGGFETGSLSGWTVSGNTSSNVNGVDNLTPHSGTYAGFFGAIGSPVVLTQTVATTTGQSYHVSFWLANETSFSGATPNSFEFLWGGTSEMSLTDAPASGYQQFQFDLVATAASTTLEFRFRQDPSFWDLDDVSVLAPAAVPAPGSLVLAALALGLMAAGGRRRHSALVAVPPES